MPNPPNAADLPTDLAAQLDLAPDLRMTSFTYREVFGCPPAVLWQVPGTVTLLADGPLRLTVAVRWGAIAAAGPGDGDLVELIHMDRPGEPARLTVREARAGDGPGWAGTALRAARGGARVLVTAGPPAGAGLGTDAAAEQAITLCLRDLGLRDLGLRDLGLRDLGLRDPAPARPDAAAPAPQAWLGARRLPFDLAAAGLRLVTIDTRVRSDPQPPAAEHAPVHRAAAALHAGHIEALGPLLTAAHRALPGDQVQDIAVSAALRSGALGARPLTEGRGRPACALLPAGRLAAVRAAIAADFADHGLRAPRLLTISPAGGPQRAQIPAPLRR